MTECIQEKLEFQGINGKRVEGRFDGGDVSTDGGALLIKELCNSQGIFNRLTQCFSDVRNAEQVKFTVKQLLEQRIYGLICGYEDLNDHDKLRNDSIFQLLTGALPGEKIAGHATLNRIELAKLGTPDRYHKIAVNESAMKEFLIEENIRHIKRKRLKRIVLDCDATDIPLHGDQEGKFYHGYYGHYCYLPLYIFCEDLPIWAELRSSNIDASKGTEAALLEIVSRLRKAFPKLEIIVRADSAFAREDIMAVCEKLGIDYVFGLAKNSRLISEIESELLQAETLCKETKLPARIFKDFEYCTQDSWSRSRRVVAKAEHLPKGSNPRFIVTSLSIKASAALELYEELYCKRGDAENRIKEQFQLFADRTSSSLKRANQLRLWLSTVAYLIMTLFKKYALQGTELANAESQTIRQKLIKLAVRISVSARRVYLSFASGFPYQKLFYKALKRT